MHKETSLYELLRLKIIRKEIIATKKPSHGMVIYQSGEKMGSEFMLQQRLDSNLSWQIFRFEIAKNTDAYIKIGYNQYYWKLVIKLADLQDSIIDKIAQLPELSEKLGLTFIVAHEIVDPDYFPNENPKNLELTFQKQDEQGTIKADESIKKYFLQKNSDMIAIFDLLEEIVKVANINSINTVFEPDDTFDLPIRKNSKDNDLYELANEIKRRLESIKFNKNNQ